MRKVWTNCNLTRTLVFSCVGQQEIAVLKCGGNGLAILRAVSGYVESESKTHKKTFIKMHWDIVKEKK